MTETKFTSRDFAVREYSDYHDNKYSIEKSNSVDIGTIWFGPYNPDLDGVSFPRMHLSREQVAELIPVLQYFVDTGELPDHTVSE